MIPVEQFKSRFPGAYAAIEARFTLLRKAVSFALIGVVNTLVDICLFFVGYSILTRWAPAVDLMATLADTCRCGTTPNVTLVVANVCSWFFAVSGSYVLNSYITFAAESGRQLSVRKWGTFVASGVVGGVANTTVLLLVAQVMPVWFAKGCATLVSFVVNFALSHFVVFRTRAEPTDPARVERNG